MADGKVVFEIEGDTSDFDSKVASLGDHADEALKKGMESAQRTVDGASGGIARRLTSMLTAPFSALGDRAAAMFPGLAERFSGLGEGAKRALDGITAVAGRVFSGLGQLALKAGAAIAAGIGAGLAAVGKFAFDAYGEYEQLQGGAELMFGEGYEYIAEHAADAYRTVQMSQNDYLRQVNGFAVGLRESLGGDERAAAELADRIVTAEADIVSATGNSAEAVQNAFTGIMRGNFIMLDNLGLGIKASKEGIQEVIDKMNEVNGTSYSIDNLADIQNALIDYVEYVGMAGYASMEGATTIQGSVASMKGAWENFLVGLADPDADISKLAGNLVDTVVGAAGTIVPAFVRAVAGAATQLPGTIARLAPVLADGIATAVAEAMGMETHEEESAGELAMRILRVLCNRIVEGAPDLIASAGELLMGIGQAAVEVAPLLVDTLISLVLDLVAVLPDAIPALLQGALAFFGGILTAVVERAPEILNALLGLLESLLRYVFGHVQNMVSAGLQLLGGLLSGVTTKASELLSWFRGLPQRIMDALGNVASKFLSVGSNIINGMIDGVRNAAGNLIGAVTGAAENALNGLKSFLGIASPSKVFRDRVGRWITLGLAEGIEGEKGELDKALERTLSFDPDPLTRLATMPAPVLSGTGGASFGAVAAMAGAARYASAQQPASGSDIASRLDRILDAVKAGRTIEVDGRVLGRTVRKAI